MLVWLTPCAHSFKHFFVSWRSWRNYQQHVVQLCSTIFSKQVHLPSQQGSYARSLKLIWTQHNIHPNLVPFQQACSKYPKHGRFLSSWLYVTIHTSNPRWRPIVIKLYTLPRKGFTFLSNPRDLPILVVVYQTIPNDPGSESLPCISNSKTCIRTQAPLRS